MMINPQFTGAFPFADGLASVQLEENGEWGFIDKTGKVVIPPQFSFPLFYSEGLVAAYGKRGSLNGVPLGYVDKAGAYVIRFNASEEMAGGTFSEGLAPVEVRPLNADGSVGSSKSGYIDKTGKMVIPASFEGASGFHDGLAAVSEKSKSGYIDKTGKFVIGPRFDGARDFSEGLAGIQIGDKWGYADQNGVVVIAPAFESVGEFAEGFAPVKINGKMGFVDPGGHILIPAEFDRVSPFTGEAALFSLGKKWGFMDKKGNKICEMPQSAH